MGHATADVASLPASQSVGRYGKARLPGTVYLGLVQRRVAF